MPQIPDAPTPSTTPRSAAGRLFDIRLLIGTLFVVYGVMLTAAGITVSDAQRAKANGININLWMGLSMLALGLLLLLWMRLKPLRHPDTDTSTTPSTTPPPPVGESGRRGR